MVADKIMKFKKNKKYSFMSQTDSFEVTWKSDSRFHDRACEKPFIYEQTVRYELDNYRNHSAYDSPKCESRYGNYVKANYVLTLNYKTECQGEMVWIPWGQNTNAFETKKEMTDFLKNEIKWMEKGEKGEYGYYNNSEFKIKRSVK